jgi:hypothetical protein
MLASAGDAVLPPAAAEADELTAPGFVEMPPIYVDAREQYAKRVEKASTDATELCSRELSCPAVRVVRAGLYRRGDGTVWTVVRLNACGEERVYEKTSSGWNDATARLR